MLLSNASRSTVAGKIKASDLYLPSEKRVFHGSKQKTSEERR